MRVRYAVAVAVLWLAGCYPVNPPLARYDPDGGYRYQRLQEPDPKNGEETLVILTFSGGGTRAAAFAYGVLSELRRTPAGPGRTLLDEVDVISSVSGGSFAAAYLGLFGQDVFFHDFKDAVLYRKLERALILRVLAPWNWPRLLSPRFSRADLAAEYYDHAIFRGKVFSQLPNHRPFIVLNATDITEGAVFSFTQEHFDRLCSDLGPVHVARGVTASSAFPVAFPPLTLKNYPKKTCAYAAPLWVVNATAGDFESNPPRFRLAAIWHSYEDAAIRHFVHLSDGGLADNIGLRAPMDALVLSDGWGLDAKVNDGVVKRIVVIVVDAKPKPASPIDRTPTAPGIYHVLNAAATNPMENYSADTVELLRKHFEEWRQDAAGYDRRRDRCDRLAAATCGTNAACRTRHARACDDTFAATPDLAPPHPRLHRIHVRFEAIPDPAARLQLEQVDTRLELSHEQVDELIDWGARLLRESPEFQNLVGELRELGTP